MVLHAGQLFTLRFHPSDMPVADADLTALFQTVTGSFAFLDRPAAPSQSALQTVSWNEFGKAISLSYDSLLAPWVEAVTVPAAPAGGDAPYFETHPAYTQFRFPGFQGGRPFELPLTPPGNHVAQVAVLRTSDFAGFGDESPQDFREQLRGLTSLLKQGIDSARCAAPPIPITWRPCSAS